MKKINGKVVLITGSTTGIGKAIAMQCLAEGASVMFHGLEKDLAEKIALDLSETEYNENFKYIIADLSKEENWSLIVDETVRQFGAIHCLVNNAATTTRCTLEELTPEKYIYINTVNVMAPTFIAQAAVKYFRLQGTGGSILNIGSINAYCGEDKLLPYAMSKGAMATMTTTLSDALWRDRIRVNQLNLDWVAKPAVVFMAEEEEAVLRQGISMP